MQNKCGVCSSVIEQGRKYCCRLCYHISTRGKYNQGHENIKKNQYKKGKSGFFFNPREINCKICDEIFISKGPNALYCSSKCIEKSRPEHTKNDFICKFCQSPFKRRAKNNAGHFCSRQCSGLFIMAHGDGHYFYKAMILNDRKCFICFQDDIELLCVHHIDRNRKNNDISNLQILCANCHYRKHFGSGKTRKRKIENINNFKERVYAFKERFFKIRNFQEHSNGSQSRETSEASCCDSLLCCKKISEKEVNNVILAFEQEVKNAKGSIQENGRNKEENLDINDGKDSLQQRNRKSKKTKEVRKI